MKKRVMLILIPIFFATILVPTLYAEESEASTTYTIQGYVVTPLLEGNSPLKDVNVSILDFEPTTTDETGYFALNISRNTNLQIRFSLAGYTLRSCPGVTTQEGNAYDTLTLTEDMYDGQGTYTITSGPTGLQCAIMLLSASEITGTVTYTGGNVIGATIVFRNTDATSNFYMETTTDSRGMFSVNCSTGEYIVTVSCNGFEKSQPVTIVVSENNDPLNFSLTKSAHASFLGFDIVHHLMILGVVFGIVTSAMMIVLSRRSDHSFNIIDDTKPDDIDEDR